MSSPSSRIPLSRFHHKAMQNITSRPTLITASALVVVAAIAITTATRTRAADDKTPAAKPSLTVTTAKPATLNIASTLGASGNVAAWQEAIVGTTVNGLRINDVRVNVGDLVQRGQVLATFAAETVEAELAQARASVAEAEAALAEAEANAARTRMLESSGALSAQQIQQYTTAAKTAAARVAAARAAQRVMEVRLAQTQVLAPDSGAISARTATVGAVAGAGQELFRMVRQNRLEWRAEVTAHELPRIKPGMRATLVTPAGEKVQGKVRVVAPTLDAQTRNALVYVDIAPGSPARVGMFARGEFELGQASALTVPQQALVLRDGFTYLFTVGSGNKVAQNKVTTGRRDGDRVEIVEGVKADQVVVSSGAAFLSDGDTVRVVSSPTAPAKPAVSVPVAKSAAK